MNVISVTAKYVVITYQVSWCGKAWSQSLKPLLELVFSRFCRFPPGRQVNWAIWSRREDGFFRTVTGIPLSAMSAMSAISSSAKSLYLRCRTPAARPGMESGTVCFFLSAKLSPPRTPSVSAEALARSRGPGVSFCPGSRILFSARPF